MHTMLKYIPILLAISAFSQETVPSEANYKVDVSVGTSDQSPRTLRFVDYRSPVEVAGIDSNGHPYIVVNGTRKKCSRKQLVKYIVNSKAISDGVKRDALAYIGAPRNVQIMGEVK